MFRVDVRVYYGYSINYNTIIYNIYIYIGFNDINYSNVVGSNYAIWWKIIIAVIWNSEIR